MGNWRRFLRLDTCCCSDTVVDSVVEPAEVFEDIVFVPLRCTSSRLAPGFCSWRQEEGGFAWVNQAGVVVVVGSVGRRCAPATTHRRRRSRFLRWRRNSDAGETDSHHGVGSPLLVEVYRLCRCTVRTCPESSAISSCAEFSVAWEFAKGIDFVNSKYSKNLQMYLDMRSVTCI